MGEEFGSSLAGWFRLSSQGVSQVCSHPKACLGHEAPLPRWLTHRLVLGVGERPRLLSTWASPQVCLSGLATWWLASPHRSHLRDHVRLCSVFYVLSWKPCTVSSGNPISHTSQPFSVWQGEYPHHPHGASNRRGWFSWSLAATKRTRARKSRTVATALLAS